MQRLCLWRVARHLQKSINKRVICPVSSQSITKCWSDMTYFQIGQSESVKSSARPFVEFSPHQDRASLMTAVGTKNPRRRSYSRAKRKSRSSKIKIVRGKVALRIGGFPGVQHVGASQIVRFVPLNKIRAAAKRVLGGSSKRTKKRSSRKGGKRRKQRRVRRRH